MGGGTLKPIRLKCPTGTRVHPGLALHSPIGTKLNPDPERMCSSFSLFKFIEAQLLLLLMCSYFNLFRIVALDATLLFRLRPRWSCLVRTKSGSSSSFLLFKFIEVQLLLLLLLLSVDPTYLSQTFRDDGQMGVHPQHS